MDRSLGECGVNSLPCWSASNPDADTRPSRLEVETDCTPCGKCDAAAEASERVRADPEIAHRGLRQVWTQTVDRRKRIQSGGRPSS